MMINLLTLAPMVVNGTRYTSERTFSNLFGFFPLHFQLSDRSFQTNRSKQPARVSEEEERKKRKEKKRKEKEKRNDAWKVETSRDVQVASQTREVLQEV